MRDILLAGQGSLFGCIEPADAVIKVSRVVPPQSLPGQETFMRKAPCSTAFASRSVLLFMCGTSPSTAVLYYLQ